jgi:RNA polymerase sigma factor (sigma-70 family)
MNAEQAKQLEAMVEAIAILYRSGAESLDDLKQEAWLSALEAASRWKEEEGASLATFARPRIHWALTKYVQRNKRNGEVSLDSVSSEDEGSDSSESLHESLGDRETQDMELERKKRFAAFERNHSAQVVEIVRLKSEGFSSKEVAERLDMTPHAVDLTVARVLQEYEGKGRSKGKRVA